MMTNGILYDKNTRKQDKEKLRTFFGKMSDKADIELHI